MPSTQYGFKASVTITGPKSLPPIPMFTIYFIFLPVYPFHSPLCTFSQNSLMCLSTRCTSGITSLPSLIIGSPLKFLNAVCNTERPSVSLILSPLNILPIASFTLQSSASCKSNCIVFCVIMFFE